MIQPTIHYAGKVCRYVGTYPDDQLDQVQDMINAARKAGKQAAAIHEGSDHHYYESEPSTQAALEEKIRDVTGLGRLCVTVKGHGECKYCPSYKRCGLISQLEQLMKEYLSTINTSIFN